jgi:hypothetical protein
MPGPTTWPADKQFIGVAKETTPGTPVAMTYTMPVEKFDPEDKPTWLVDKAMRGSMVEEYGLVQGVLLSEFSFSGPAFLDGLGFWLNNILGDLVESGTPTGSGATTLASTASSGASSLSTVATIPNGTTIQIDTGVNSEVFTTGTPTGSGPFTIPLVGRTLAATHNSGVAVTPIQAPFSKAFSTLNSGTAQPGTLTITDWQGPPATNLARVWAGCCLSELTLKGNAESELIMVEGKGNGWKSAIAGAIPTSAPTTAAPVASWRSLLGIGGPATGGTLDSTIGSWEIKIMRKLKPIFTGQNSQNPFIIQRGAVTATGKLDFAAPAAETNPLLQMLNNSQPQFQWTLTNGGAGAALLGLTVDVQAAAFDTAKIARGAELVQYNDTFKAVSNTTNAGVSAGYSPVKVTLQNNVAAATY